MMKRLLILIVALIALSDVSSQQIVDLNLQGTKTETIILGGPVPSYPVALSLEVSYQPKEELVTVVVKGDNRVADTHISSKKTKDQITHLLFPINCNGFQYKNINFQTYFKGAAYNSNAVLETQMKQQTSSKNDTDIFRSVFEVINGEIKNKSENDIILPLQDGKLTLTIKVMDLDKPVVLTINNVIPFYAEKEGTLKSNKFHLKYISNSATITLNIPEDKCARQYNLIPQYERLNKNLRNELKGLLQYQDENQSDKEGLLQQQWQLLYKYKEVRQRVETPDTECDELLQQFGTFNDYYDQIIELNALTPDSLRGVIDELDTLYYKLDKVRKGSSGTCKKLKNQAQKIIPAVELDEEAFEFSGEAYDLVHRFNNLKEDIEEVVCPVSNPTPVDTNKTTPPLPDPKPSQCNCKKFREAAKKINEWDNQYWENGMNNKPAFNILVGKMEGYLNSLPESCKKDKKCKDMIDEYEGAKRMYLDDVK